jgi:hypothetical protein
MKAKRAASGKDRAAVERARGALAKAADALAAGAAALSVVADSIAGAAVEAEREALATELAADRILRDAVELRQAFAAAPAGSLPPAVEALRKLPDALLDWASRRFGVQPHLERGDELEVPADRVSGYELDGPPPPRGLVRLRILAPGWKRAGKVLVKPQAVRI